MTYLDTLRKLAQAATPGPWLCSEEIEGRHITDQDAVYIAALSPERVLALVECVRASKAARMMNTDETIATLDAELAKLEESCPT